MIFSSIADWVRRRFARPHDPLRTLVDTDDRYIQFELLMRLREGVRNVVYLDSEGHPTVGIGHLIKTEDNLRVGMKITDGRVSRFFEKDGRRAFDAAVDQMMQAGITDQSFLPYLASVNFQLGVEWRRKFPNTWARIESGDYLNAASQVSSSLWAQQTPVRVKDFQGALRRLPPKDTRT